MDLKIYNSHSPEETEKIGQALANDMSESNSLPKFVALYGDLGVGKTAFVRGFTSVFAPSARVKSPTFALVNEYRGDKITLYHFDMYRINGEFDLETTGFYDYMSDDSIIAAEWSENIEDCLPEGTITISIETLSENTRKITVFGDERFESLGD